MTVYVVTEESHGEIIYAASKEAAKRALIDTDWVRQNSDIWIENDKEEYRGHNATLVELYGENWKEEFVKLDDAALENMGFYISDYEVWE